MRKTATQTAAPGDGGFLDTAGVLARVPYSRRTLFDLEQAGVIPYIQIGRKKLYDWDCVRAALLRRQQGGAA